MSNSPIRIRSKLDILFRKMGYVPVARHKTKNITLYRQGDVTYVLNAEPGSFGMKFVDTHGPCAPSMAWRVVDAQKAFEHAVARGATPYEGDDKTMDVPAIVGIGGSLLYFVDTYGERARPIRRNSTGCGSSIRSRKASVSIISTT